MIYLLLCLCNIDPYFHSLHFFLSKPITYSIDVNCFLSKNILMGAIKRRARRERSKEHAEKALYYCLLFMYLFWEITTYQTIYGIVVILLVSFWMTLEQQNVKSTKIKLYRFNICGAVYLFSYRKIFFSNKCFTARTS